MNVSAIKQKINNITSVVSAKNINDDINDEMNQIKNATLKELDTIAHSKLVQQIENILKEIENISESIFYYAYNFVKNFINQSYDMIMTLSSSSLCCMMLPLIILAIIFSMVLNLIKQTEPDNKKKIDSPDNTVNNNSNSFNTMDTTYDNT